MKAGIPVEDIQAAVADAAPPAGETGDGREGKAAFDWACPECDARCAARPGDTTRRCSQLHAPRAMVLTASASHPMVAGIDPEREAWWGDLLRRIAAVDRSEAYADGEARPDGRVFELGRWKTPREIVEAELAAAGVREIPSTETAGEVRD